MKVGFIGLGNMGGAVARNIQRAGFELVVPGVELRVAGDWLPFWEVNPPDDE